MSRDHFESKVRRSLLRSGVIHRIQQGDPLEEILKRIIENVEAQSDQMLAAVFFYDPQSQDLCVGAAPNLHPVYKKAVNGFKAGTCPSVYGSSLFKSERVIAHDVKTDPLWKQFAGFAVEANVRAVWAEPVFDSQANVLGTVVFYFPQPKSATPSDLVILESTAELVAIAIEARPVEFTKLNNKQRKKM
jgi:GAF domain-containing protein